MRKDLTLFGQQIWPIGGMMTWFSHAPIRVKMTWPTIKNITLFGHQVIPKWTNWLEEGKKSIRNKKQVLDLQNQRCPPRGNMAMSFQLVIQIVIGRENLVLPKALTLPGRKRRRRRRLKHLWFKIWHPWVWTLSRKMRSHVWAKCLMTTILRWWWWRWWKKKPNYLWSPNNPHCHGLWRWHEWVSYPQTTFKEENEAMQQLMNELNARCLVLWVPTYPVQEEPQTNVMLCLYHRLPVEEPVPKRMGVHEMSWVVLLAVLRWGKGDSKST